MLRPITPGETFRVTSKYDKPPEPVEHENLAEGESPPEPEPFVPTEFECRIFPSRILAFIEDQKGEFEFRQGKDKEEQRAAIVEDKPAARALEVFRLGVVDVHNWDGKLQTRTRNVGGVLTSELTDDCLNRFPWPVIKEIAGAIVARNTLPEDVLGN